MKNLPERRAKWIRLRVSIMLLLLLVGVGTVVRRAWELQVEAASPLAKMAEEQHQLSLRLAPKRGTIYDRNGAELAVSVEVDSVWANPRLLKKQGATPAAVTAQLRSVLPALDAKRIHQRLSSDRYFVWIRRHITPRQAAAIKQLKLPGVAMSKEARRFYPNRELASHLLGFANVDGKGIEGLELALEDRLRGRIESTAATRDRHGSVVFSEEFLDDRATQGEDIVLSLDKSIQHRAEQELAYAVQHYEARAGSVVVMDPHNGDVLAMANYPSYNPNDPGESPPANRRNRAVTDRFEPGSTVKMFTVASALESGAIRPNQRIDCGQGLLQIGEFIIHDTHKWGRLTPTEILVHSSNIGISRIGLSMGKARMFRSLRRYGFGEKTDVGLPGEAQGILRHYSKWYDMDAATVPFGQGMSATAIQLAVATSAIANGGKLLKPVLIKRVQSARGELLEENKTELRRVAVAGWAANRVARMLKEVASEEGTGVEAAIDGYEVAGKTGTAQKADYIAGGYARNKWIASFAGFVPANNPRLAIVVVIDEPTVEHTGGTVAAPVFRRVKLAALHHLGVPSDGRSKTLLAAHKGAKRKDTRQDTDMLPGIIPASYLKSNNASSTLQEQTTVPYLIGKSARAAIVMTYRSNLELTLSGSGVVSSQQPQAGALVVPGSRLQVELAEPDYVKTGQGG
ncbi:MAG: transpeptidase family protein [Myxococcales bacterium]|nr:MAG: transpeptidase family protein [Myxococcales bacterium]